MADEKQIAENKGTNLSQSNDKHVEVEDVFIDVFEDEAKKKSRHSFPPSDKMMTMADGFDDTFQRPRSFSDASVSSGRHGFKTVKNVFHLRGMTSMKVFVRRESQVISKTDGQGKSAVAEGVPTGSHGHRFEALSKSSERVLSLDNIADKPSAKQSAPPKPRLPSNYRQYLNEQLKHYKEASDKQGNSGGNLQESHSKTDNMHSRNVERLDKSKDINHGDKSRSQDILSENRMKPPAGNLRRGRSSVSELSLRPNSVIYRHFDQQLQSQLLKKELDNLRVSKNVRRKSETMRQWLENESRRKSVGDLHVRFADEVISKEGKGDLDRDTFRSKTLPRQSKSLDLIVSQNKPGDKNSDRPSAIAYPQSGNGGSMQPKDNIAGRLNAKPVEDKNITHESRSLTLTRDQGRSKSATALGRSREFSRQESDWKPLEASQKTQLSRSATNLRRKQNTITKFNYSAVEQKRENVRTRYQQSDKKDRIESFSPGLDDIDKPAETKEAEGNSVQKADLRVGTGNKVSADLRDNKTIGDNRSDEEKYAALSQSKILHSKSSSWDTQSKYNSLIKKHEETKLDNRRQAKPGTSYKSGANVSERMNLTFRSDKNAQRLNNIGAQGVNKPKDKDLRSKKSTDNNLSYSDSECVVSKGARSAHNVPNVGSGTIPTSQQGKIVLRQCRIGSDVVFGLVAVQDGATKPSSVKVSLNELSHLNEKKILRLKSAHFCMSHSVKMFLLLLFL